MKQVGALMSISFSNALGIHEQALELRVNRAEVLANNLANADTPGFKARDLDFKAILGNEMNNHGGAKPLAMSTTDGQHLSHANGGASGELLYRTPSQPSVDGNTVDTQEEMAEFMKNTLQYQSSFQFLNGKFKSLTNAIRGE
jgi:flagellar basal-body rod protein FlgB